MPDLHTIQEEVPSNLDIRGEIAKHRKTGIQIIFSIPPASAIRRRYHSLIYNHHLRKAARLTERGIGEFPGVDLKLTPYAKPILAHLAIAKEHIDAENRILGRKL